MKNSDRDPTRGELDAMAYFDGQLEGEQMRQFEARMELDLGLAREVAAYRALDFALKRSAPSEPIDVEWERQRKDRLQFGLFWLSVTSAAAGALLLFVTLCSAAFGSSALRYSVAGATLLVGGALALIVRGIRGRALELPFDPYVNVKR